jgi:hypothetical protein
MRKSLLDQLPLVPVTIDHDHARELAAVSVLLDRMPEAVKLIHEELAWRGKKRVDPTKGRHGTAAEQVPRAGMLKQMENFSYHELASCARSNAAAPARAGTPP